MVKWAFLLLGFNNVGFEFILGKMFIPISYALGVEWKDCEAVGHVIGTKTIINELVAYRLLGEYNQAGEISVRLLVGRFGFLFDSESSLASIICHSNVRDLWFRKSKRHGNHDRRSQLFGTRTATVNH